MNTLIKQETVNFHTLVTTNCPNTNLNFQSKLIDELNTTFTENEQKWYVANLYMYLNYHPTNDFPINLDDIYKMIGFANKGNAMVTIKNNFIENEDYKKQLLRTQKLVKNNKSLGGSGLNQEKVMLNVDTFKNICMIAKTDKAKEIRKYYVKLENIYNKLINDEHKQHQLELQEKESKLIKQKEEHNNTINKLQKEKSLERHNILLQEFGTIGCVVYVIRVKSYDNGCYVIKIGESRRGVLNRWNEHKSKYDEAVILDCFNVHKSKDFENFLHNHKDIKNNRVKDLPNHENDKELFLIGKDLSYTTLKNIIEQNIKYYNDINLEYEKSKLQNETSELEIKKLQYAEQMYKNTDLKDTLEMSKDIKFLIDEMSQLKNLLLEIKNQKTTKLTNGFNEPLKTLGPRLQKVNPDTMQLVEWYESVSECMKENTNIKRPSINKAIVDNTIYQGYRWILVDRNLDPKKIHNICPTKVTKVQNIGYIAKLNKDKTKILNIYLDRKTASELNGYKSSSSLDEIVKNEKISNEHYYVLYSKCNDELKKAFLNSDKELILYKDGIGKFDINGNLIKEFTSKNDCIIKENIGTKTLNKILYNNLCYENYYYRYLEHKIFV
jgi:phage anti-repressor protein